MPASRAVTGNNWTFSIGTVASPLSYSAVLEVKDIEQSLLSVPEVSTTHLLSPSSTEEFIPGLIKPGKITVTVNAVGDTTQLSLLNLAQAQDIIFWKASGPIDKSSKVYTGNGTGFISNYTGPTSVQQNKAVEIKFDVQITGPITEGVA